MAAIILLLGSVVSVQAMLSNHHNAAQIAALGNSTIGTPKGPSVVKPTAAAISQYSVAQNMPRYVNIPALGIHARVQAPSLTSNLFTDSPSNIYDVNWESESSLPGEPGAVVLNGHAGVGSAHGVFYNIQTLKPGDHIQLIRGDGVVFTYQVITVQTYPGGMTDAQSLLSPIVANSFGLNIITTGGDKLPGTSNPNEQIVVKTLQL
jgi:sortase (surface protein transpeptidase)